MRTILKTIKNALFREKTKTKSNVERRSIHTGSVEVREKDGKTFIRGYGAVFNSDSEDLGGFVERIQPGFFRDVLGNDVVAAHNHDPSRDLGRTPDTLRVGEDERGLWYEIEADLEDEVTRSVIRKIKRGQLKGSSFAFEVHDDGDTLERDDKRGLIRTLIPGGCKRLIDVGPVTYPAYQATSVGIRSRVEAFEDDQPEPKPEAGSDTGETPDTDTKETDRLRELEMLRIELEMEEILK